jgi:hypothetical protein
MSYWQSPFLDFATRDTDDGQFLDHTFLLPGQAHGLLSLSPWAVHRVVWPGMQLVRCAWVAVASVGQLWPTMPCYCVLECDKRAHHATRVSWAPRGEIGLGFGATPPFHGRRGNIVQTWGGAPTEVIPSSPYSLELARSLFWSRGDMCFFLIVFSMSFANFLDHAIFAAVAYAISYSVWSSGTSFCPTTKTSRSPLDLDSEDDVAI